MFNLVDSSNTLRLGPFVVNVVFRSAPVSADSSGRLSLQRRPCRRPASHHESQDISASQIPARSSCVAPPVSSHQDQKQKKNPLQGEAKVLLLQGKLGSN